MLVQDRLAAALKCLIVRRFGPEPMVLDDGLHEGVRRDRRDGEIDTSDLTRPNSRYTF